MFWRMITSVAIPWIKRSLALSILITELSIWSEKGKVAITASVCEASILRIIMVLRGNSDKCGLIVCGGKGARAPRTVEFYRIIVQRRSRGLKRSSTLGNVFTDLTLTFLFREEHSGGRSFLCKAHYDFYISLDNLPVWCGPVPSYSCL